MKAMAGARKSFPKKPGRVQSDSLLRWTPLLASAVVLTMTGLEQTSALLSRDMPTGMNRRWKKLKGTPAESHPSVFVLIGSDS